MLFLLRKYRERQAVGFFAAGVVMGAVVNEFLRSGRRSGVVVVAEEAPLSVEEAPFEAKLLPLEMSEFRGTLRSCLGAACLTATPAGSRRPRVALLSPSESATARALWSLVSVRARDVELVIDSHAPCYGYGRNHGLTRIVRLALPLAVDAMNSTALLRQAIRWHCRVSHVAAHTALLTIDEDDLKTPRKTLERLLSFVGLKVDRDLLTRATKDFSTSVQAALNADLAIPNPQKYNAALRDELEASNSLKDWPCQTLWVTTEDDRHLVRQRAPLLAPNCSAPFVKCDVPRDKCEQQGTCSSSASSSRQKQKASSRATTGGHTTRRHQ